MEDVTMKNLRRIKWSVGGKREPQPDKYKPA
jgi:hypothetical protein